MNILSIQSSVVAGHVGNSAAGPALQRLGFTVWRLDTVQFSNHPAHGQHRGHVVASEALADLVEGLKRAGTLGACDAVISGYLGEPATGPIVLDAVARVRAQRAGAPYLCDPVIGDHGRRYVRDGIAEFFRDVAVPAADIVTPNSYEAGLLTGHAVGSVAEALSACDRLRATGPGIAVVTGVEQGDHIVVVGAAEGRAWAVTTPRLDTESYGAGDLFAALLLGFHLRGQPFEGALAHAVSGVHGVIRAGAAANAKDLPLIAAQDMLVTPPHHFPAERLR